MDTGHVLLAENLGSKEALPDENFSWPLPQTLFGLGIVLGAYLTVVLKILPTYMKSKEPYRLKGLLAFYNSFQVIYSSYLVFIYTRYLLTNGLISTKCPKGEDLQKVINEIYLYFLAKHMDFLDTVFFILRKKDNQVSFLHVYHHSIMVSWTWLHYVYYPTDHFVFVGLLNSFVHVLMYAYYGISSLGPEYAKFVWWKKHLTKVQLVQFILAITNLYYQQKLTACPIPVFFHYYCIGSLGSFFVLFMDFYFRSYRAKLVRRKNREN